MPRQDFVTQTQLKQIFYSDFSTNLDQTPFSADLAVLTNENDIKQALQNLIRTVLGERLYDNTTGSTVNALLFELMDGYNATLAQATIKNTIQASEPRVQVRNVKVNELYDLNAVEIQIFYIIVNTQKQQNTTVILKKIR